MASKDGFPESPDWYSPHDVLPYGYVEAASYPTYILSREDPSTHIISAVSAKTHEDRRIVRHTVRELLALAALADTEFETLRTNYHVQVPPVEWHVDQIEELGGDAPLLIARVGVVDGLSLQVGRGVPLSEQIIEARQMFAPTMQAYLDELPRRPKLAVDECNLIIGSLRQDPRDPRPFMVNISPFFDFC